MANKDSFIYQAHCEEKKGKFIPSSKRWNGSIGWNACQVCIVISVVLSWVISGELSGTVASLIDFDLGLSAGLIGLSTIMRGRGGNYTATENKNITPEKPNDEE